MTQNHIDGLKKPNFSIVERNTGGKINTYYEKSYLGSQPQAQLNSAELMNDSSLIKDRRKDARASHFEMGFENSKPQLPI